MAPLTKADAETSAKMREIRRVVWSNEKGIDLTPGEDRSVKMMIGERRALQHRPNKNPGANRDITLTPWKVDGEETTRVFIADPWPPDSDPEKKELLRRQLNGQGPIVGQQMVPLADGGTLLLDIFDARKKRWTRTDRRIKAAIGRAARRRNAMSARKPAKKLRQLGSKRGPSPRNPENFKKQEEAAAA